MQEYIGLIASMDDYGHPEDGVDIMEEMITAFEEKEDWIHAYPFSAPDDLSQDLVVLIARGLFWDAQWSADDTVSVVVREDATLDEAVDELEDDEVDTGADEEEEVDPDDDLIIETIIG
jgi:hypothetical protein